jgi:hypothetical protein
MVSLRGRTFTGYSGARFPQGKIPIVAERSMSGPDEFNLVCGECGSEYKVRENNRLRGPGAFACQVCGEDVFLWICQQNIDYDFQLIRSGDAPGE